MPMDAVGTSSKLTATTLVELIARGRHTLANGMRRGCAQ